VKTHAPVTLIRPLRCHLLLNQEKDAVFVLGERALKALVAIAPG